MQTHCGRRWLQREEETWVECGGRTDQDKQVEVGGWWKLLEKDSRVGDTVGGLLLQGKRRGGHAARPCWAGGEKRVLSPPPLFLRVYTDTCEGEGAEDMYVVMLCCSFSGPAEGQLQGCGMRRQRGKGGTA